MAKGSLGLLKGFVQGAVWAGSGDTRLLLPFDDTITEATMTYTGELAETMTYSDAGILGVSNACLSTEEVMFELSTSNLTWSALQAATLSTAVAQAAPVMVVETFTASTLVAGDTTITTTYAPVVTAPEILANGLPSVGVTVGNANGQLIEATDVTGSVITLDGDFTGQRITVQYLRAAIAGEESILLGSGTRREQVGLYGTFFGCPGSLLVVAPRTAVVPNLNFGVSQGNIASAGLSLKALRTNGYFVQITALDCPDC